MSAQVIPELQIRFGFVPDTDKALIQVRMGDLFQNVTFPAPSILAGDNMDWRKGELRRTLDSTVLAMCHQIVKHGSIFKCKEGCVSVVRAMERCPSCQPLKLEVVE